MLRATVSAAASLSPTDVCVLANDQLEVVFAPVHGGKIVSLLNRETATEWILPPLRPYAEAQNDAGFEAWDGGGFDECLPTIAATTSAPDHGEVWRKLWSAQEEPNRLTMSTTACDNAIAFTREAHLDGASLVLAYTVRNGSAQPQSLLYSAHPLLRVEEGDRIELPGDVDSVRVEGSLHDRLGLHGALVPWPMRGEDDLSQVGPPDGSQADKLFAGPLTQGCCRLLRPSTGEAIELSFDADVLPYLGLWICRAAWPDAGEAKQYTVALEPTHAACDSLAQAEQEGTAWRLQPGETRAWTLRLRVLAGQGRQQG